MASLSSLFSSGHSTGQTSRTQRQKLKMIEQRSRWKAIIIFMIASRVAPFRTPEPPVFSSPAEERQHRKERLAASLRLFSRFGFDQGVAGHITARDPELTDHFWVNPFGQHFGQVRVSDLILVNHSGDVVEGEAR